MSEVNTNAASVEAVAAKPAVKKATKKAATKKVVKKAATKKAATKTVATTPAKKDGLRKGQIAVMLCLLKKDGLSRPQIAEKASVDLASLTGLIGPLDADKRKYNDETYFKTLITWGYVKGEQHDIDGKNVVLYSLTANGRKAAEALKASK